MHRQLLQTALLAFFAIAFATFATSAAQAAGAVRKSPAPTWVVPVPIPEPSPKRGNQVSGGIYFLLVDHQERPRSPGDVDYRRLAFQVTDREGLEQAGKIDIDFDPSSDDISLHHIRLIRDGIAQDRIGSIVIQTLQREEDLEQGILTGLKQVHLELKDIRVGDIIDYAYSRTTQDFTLGGQFFTTQSLAWSAPAGLTHFRLLWPHDMPITMRRFAGAPPPRLTRSGDRDVYEWRIEDPEPIPGEADSPSWQFHWAEVTASNMTSWAEVVAWARPLYERQD